MYRIVPQLHPHATSLRRAATCPSNLGLSRHDYGKPSQRKAQPTRSTTASRSEQRAEESHPSRQLRKLRCLYGRRKINGLRV